MSTIQVQPAVGGSPIPAQLLSAPSKDVESSQRGDDGCAVAAANIGWARLTGNLVGAHTFVAVVHVADAPADTYEEVTPANEKKVWKRPKLPSLMACNNRDTLPDGTVIPRIPEKMYSGLVKRHENHEEMRRAATRWWAYTRTGWLADGRSRKFPVMFKEFAKAHPSLGSVKSGLQWFAQVITRMEQKQADPEPLGRQRKPKRKHAKVATAKATETAGAGAGGDAGGDASPTKAAEFGASEWDVDATATGEQGAGSAAPSEETKLASKKARHGSDAGDEGTVPAGGDPAADGTSAQKHKKKKKKKDKKAKKAKRAKGVEA